MKRLFITLFTFSFSLFTIYGFAQKHGQALLDSLVAQLPKAKEDKNKVNLYDKIILEYLEIGSYDGLQYEKPATDALTLPTAPNKFGPTLLPPPLSAL